MVAVIGTVLGIALTYFAHWIIEHVARSGLPQEIVYGWWPIAALIAVTGSVFGDSDARREGGPAGRYPGACV